MDIKKVGSLHSRGIIFQYFCQGESHSSRLLLTQGNVNKRVADVCTTFREVRIVYKQDPPWFELDTDTNTIVDQGSKGRDGEILSHFLQSHKLIPTWIDYDWLLDGVFHVSRINFQINLPFQKLKISSKIYEQH